MRHRELLWQFVQRQVKVRYRHTVLGALWAILQPLSLMVVLTVVFSRFARIPSDGIPYPLFSYSGLLPWTFFSTALTVALPSIITNSHIITKVYFPREIVPLTAVFSALVDFAIASVVYTGILIFYQVRPTWNVLYLLPLLVIQVTFTTGVSLLLSAFTALYRDVRFTWPLVLQLWMFATPILYPVSVVPERLRGAYMALNPMAVIVDGWRRALVQGHAVDLVPLGSAAGIAILALALGYHYFKRLERQFADIV